MVELEIKETVDVPAKEMISFTIPALSRRQVEVRQPRHGNWTVISATEEDGKLGVIFAIRRANVPDLIAALVRSLAAPREETLLQALRD